MKKLASTKISGLEIIHLDVFYDFRGENFEYFSMENHSFTDLEGNPIQFVEDHISISNKHVLRGLHGDETTWKLIQCVHGEMYMVVVDLRKNSSTYLNWEAYHSNNKNHLQILVPAGCVSGNLCLTEKGILLQRKNQFYAGAENQIVVRWNDPKINIFWPISNPILSQRDSFALDLRNL